MHPGGMRSAMDLFDFEKSANLKHPNVHSLTYYAVLVDMRKGKCIL